MVGSCDCHCRSTRTVSKAPFIIVLLVQGKYLAKVSFHGHRFRDSQHVIQSSMRPVCVCEFLRTCKKIFSSIPVPFAWPPSRGRYCRCLDTHSKQSSLLHHHIRLRIYVKYLHTFLKYRPVQARDDRRNRCLIIFLNLQKLSSMKTCPASQISSTCYVSMLKRVHQPLVVNIEPY